MEQDCIATLSKREPVPHVQLFYSFFGENKDYIDLMLLNLNLADQDLQNKKINVQGYLGKL